MMMSLHVGYHLQKESVMRRPYEMSHVVFISKLIELMSDTTDIFISYEKQIHYSIHKNNNKKNKTICQNITPFHLLTVFYVIDVFYINV